MNNRTTLHRSQSKHSNIYLCHILFILNARTVINDQAFISFLEDNALKFYHYPEKVCKPMLPLTRKQLKDFEFQNICHICDRETTKNLVKMRGNN